MAKINIPEGVKPGFKDILSLNENQVNLLYDTLSKAPKNELYHDIEKDLIESGFDQTVAANISYSVRSFAELIAENQNINGDLGKVLAESYYEIIDDNEKLICSVDKLTERLSHIILLSDFLLTGYEGVRIVWDNNKVYSTAYITTETTLLNNRTYSLPNPGILINKLDIKYKEHGEFKNVNFVLDNADLMQLKVLIDNTIKENIEIRSKLNQFVKFLDFE